MYSVPGKQKRPWKLNSLLLKRALLPLAWNCLFIYFSWEGLQLCCERSGQWQQHGALPSARVPSYCLCLSATFTTLRKGETVLAQLEKSVSYRKWGILHSGGILSWGLNTWRETCTPGVWVGREMTATVVLGSKCMSFLENRREYCDSCSTGKQGNLTVSVTNGTSTFPCRGESLFLWELTPGFLKNNYIIKVNKKISSMIKKLTFKVLREIIEE